MGIDKIIRLRRKKLGLTMKELAAKVGVSEGTVSRWESGSIKEIRGEKIFRLTQILEISLEDINASLVNPPLTLLQTSTGLDKPHQPEALQNNLYTYISFNEAKSLFYQNIDYRAKQVIPMPDIVMGCYAGNPSILFLQATDDSMNRVFGKDTLLAVLKSNRLEDYANGDIVILLSVTGYIVRRYYNHETYKRVTLVPESTSSKFLPITILYKKDQIDDILGKVVMIFPSSHQK